jgi:hypothetical protein
MYGCLKPYGKGYGFLLRFPHFSFTMYSNFTEIRKRLFEFEEIRNRLRKFEKNINLKAKLYREVALKNKEENSEDF